MLFVYAAFAIACIALPAMKIAATGNWIYMYLYIFTTMMAGLTVALIIDTIQIFKPHLPHFGRDDEKEQA
jgi:hypothetical protein